MYDICFFLLVSHIVLGMVILFTFLKPLQTFSDELILLSYFQL